MIGSIWDLIYKTSKMNILLEEHNRDGFKSLVMKGLSGCLCQPCAWIKEKASAGHIYYENRINMGQYGYNWLTMTFLCIHALMIGQRNIYISVCENMGTDWTMNINKRKTIYCHCLETKRWIHLTDHILTFSTMH